MKIYILLFVGPATECVDQLTVIGGMRRLVVLKNRVALYPHALENVCIVFQ